MSASKAVLITGAARRIGRGIALRLFQAGYRVGIHYGNSEFEARETAAQCGFAPRFERILKAWTKFAPCFGRSIRASARCMVW